MGNPWSATTDVTRPATTEATAFHDFNRWAWSMYSPPTVQEPVLVRCRHCKEKTQPVSGGVKGACTSQLCQNRQRSFAKRMEQAIYRGYMRKYLRRGA